MGSCLTTYALLFDLRCCHPNDTETASGKGDSLVEKDALLMSSNNSEGRKSDKKSPPQD